MFNRDKAWQFSTTARFFRPASVVVMVVCAFAGCEEGGPDLGEGNDLEDAGDPGIPDAGKPGILDVAKPSTPDVGKPGKPDVDDPEREVGTVEMSMGLTLGAGQESTVCVNRRLPTTHPMDVVKVTADLPPGGHHLVFYRSNATVENTTPMGCSSGVFGNEAPLIIAQKKHSELLFPQGVAYVLPAGQMMRFELHFLNTTTAPLDLTATVQLTGAEVGAVTDHANLIFTGNLSISIPPQSTTIVGPTTATFDDHEPIIFGVTGHQHQRGTRFVIEFGDPAGSMTTIYDNNDWAEPPLTIFDPPIATKRGQGLRFTCVYANPTNQTIGFGERATDEMCFLWAYYYPDMGYNFRPPP